MDRLEQVGDYHKLGLCFKLTYFLFDIGKTRLAQGLVCVYVCFSVCVCVLECTV